MTLWANNPHRTITLSKHISYQIKQHYSPCSNHTIPLSPPHQWFRMPFNRASAFTPFPRGSTLAAKTSDLTTTNTASPSTPRPPHTLTQNLMPITYKHQQSSNKQQQQQQVASRGWLELLLVAAAVQKSQQTHCCAPPHTSKPAQ